MKSDATIRNTVPSIGFNWSNIKRNHLGRQIMSRQFCCNGLFPVRKKVLVRLEPRTFAIPGVFITSTLSSPEALRNSILLWAKIQIHSIKQVANPKNEPIPRYDNTCYDKACKLNYLLDILKYPTMRQTAFVLFRNKLVRYTILPHGKFSLLFFEPSTKRYLYKIQLLNFSSSYISFRANTLPLWIASLGTEHIARYYS